MWHKATARTTSTLQQSFICPLSRLPFFVILPSVCVHACVCLSQFGMRALQLDIDMTKDLSWGVREENTEQLEGAGT